MTPIMQLKFSSILLVNAALIVVNFVFAGTRALAVSLVPGFAEPAAASGGTDFDTIAKIFTLISGVVTVIIFLVGLIWFIWRGKNLEQLQRSNTEWKDLAESRAQRIAENNARIAQLEADKIRYEAEIQRMRAIQDNLLIENLRLGGKKNKELKGG